MTDNFQDFDQNETPPHEETKAAQTGLRANLSGAWRSQPLFKLFVLMVVVGAIVAVAVSLFSGDVGKSAVGFIKPPDLHEAPGGKSTPYLKEQTEMENKRHSDEAIQTGGSSVATPIGPGTDNGELGANPAKEDPLNELHAEIENMNKQLQETKQAQMAPPPPQQANEPFDDTLAQAMQRQMGQLLDSWAPKGTRLVGVYDLELLNREKQTDQDKASQSVGVGTAGAAVNAVAKTIVPAGTVSYAQLLTEANSDVPGPILALIVSGPLKGARAIGRFQVTNAYSDYLVLTFKLADRNGADYRINAIALDPDTTLGGMATEVDQRYFTRLVLPAAAGFLQGFASALGQGNSSISTNGTTTIIQQSGKSVQEGEYTGLSDAALTASQFFQTQANNTMPLVRVAAGTPMGLFFVDTVTDEPAQNAQANANGNNNQNPYGMQNGYPQNGQGGYGQGGYGQGYGSNNGMTYSNGSSNGGYPVLYPSSLPQQMNAGTSYGGFGTVAQPGVSYPGSSVYYTH